jgi:hypothetical protein
MGTAKLKSTRNTEGTSALFQLILTSCFTCKDIGWKNSGDLSYTTVALQQKEDTQFKVIS